MEREFAARGGLPAQAAGTFEDEWVGTDLETALDLYAWYIVNSGYGSPGGGSHSFYGTHPVGTKLPNELGLYDMSGNVWNWVWDIWQSSHPSGSYTNPTGSASGIYRVRRGGYWSNYTDICTVSVRYRNTPTYTDYYYGFRVCRISP